jgi:5-methylthioadenosine/S-adenosylhomocysteine deaminase
MSKTTVLSNALLLTPGPAYSARVSRGHVVVEADKIKAVVREKEELAVYSPFHEIDLENHLIIPGLINLHAHLRPVRAFGDGLGLHDWHDHIAEPFSRLVCDEDAYYGAVLSFTELLKNGVTTVLTFSTHFMAERQAALDTGIRAIMVPAANSEKDLDPALDVLRAGDHERVTTWLGVELANRCPLNLLQKISKMAREYSTGLHTHFSEAERQDISHLVEGGILPHSPTILAHCIQVNEWDIAQFKKYNTCVAHNPKSNARLGNGVAPIPEFLANDINVGLGTDGPLSTFSLSFLEEMRVAVLLQRAFRRDPALLTSGQVFSMATVLAAAGLGMKEKIGSIEPGKQADLVAINLDSLHLTPHIFRNTGAGNIPELLIHTVKHSDIAMVLVAGQPVIAGGKSQQMDEKKVIDQVQQRSSGIIEKLNW